MLDEGPIIVPLDGSELAERALPYAQRLASALRTHLVLVTVWEGADAALGAAFMAAAPEIERAARERWTAYLHEARDRAGATGAKTVVREGDATDEILRVADEERARLIVIATHGRSGIGRWVYGSTASQLLRTAARPLLAVGPELLSRKREPEMRRIMVPLDGSSLAEQALPAATALARALDARVSIVRAVRWAIESYPYTVPTAYLPQLDDELAKAADAYVHRIAGNVQAPGGVDAHVLRGPAAQSLIDFAERAGIDLVVMTTHARGGIARAALGSTADRMLHGPAPVVLIPPGAAGQEA
jgi:nucleotide-binding universal stress UspA family protein